MFSTSFYVLEIEVNDSDQDHRINFLQVYTYYRIKKGLYKHKVYKFSSL